MRSTIGAFAAYLFLCFAAAPAAAEPLVVAGFDGERLLVGDVRLRCEDPEELWFDCKATLPAEFRAAGPATLTLNQEGYLTTLSYSGSMSDYDAVSAWLSRTYGAPQQREGLDHSMRETLLGWTFDADAVLTLNRAVDGFSVLVAFPQNMAVSARFSRPSNQDMSWALVLAGQRGPAIFVDQRHVTVAGPLRTAWVREAFDTPQRDGTMRRDSRMTFSCTAEWSAVLAFQRIAGNTRVLEEKALEMEELTTQPVRRGSPLGSARSYLCRLPLRQIEIMRRD